MKRKIFCAFLAAVFISSVLCGCAGINKKPASLGDSIDIPNDGIISGSVFQELLEQNKTVTFEGMSGDISYCWIVFGSEIEINEIKDLCLGIEITEATDEKLSFRYMSEEDFGFSPALSIYLNCVWDAQSAYLLTDDGKKQAVTITGKDQSILNFSPTSQTGECVIVPDIEKGTYAETDTVTNPIDTVPVGDNASDTTSAIAEEAEQSVIIGDETIAVIKDEIEAPATTAPDESQRPISDGSGTGKDQYKTDPVPEGKPLPVEPDTEEVNDEVTYTCTFSIECSTILNNIGDLDPDKLDVLPADGIIFKAQTVVFYEGESVYDVLERVCRENKIHMEASWTPMYNSAYVEGIGNLYEFDCGSGSGWMYRVDGWYPNYGCSRYQLQDGETVEWRYTCDLGSDIGGGYAMGD